MKRLKFLFLLIPLSMFSQEVATLESVIGKVYDFSQERQDTWIVCDSLMYGSIGENQTPAEKFAQEEKCYDLGYDDACESIWSVVCGNDWTDEGYPYDRSNFAIVSSALKPQGDNTYGSTSISDLNYKTAWVEGVKGYGIGECVIFEFPPLNPRIHKVIIANGYIKDKKIWKNNSRVKQLKMFLNDSLYAILNLKDVYAEQSFEVPTIGFAPRKHIPATYHTKEGVLMNERNDKVVPNIKITFEIGSVYKGDKYDDTAITEIYFNGLDVY